MTTGCLAAAGPKERDYSVLPCLPRVKGKYATTTKFQIIPESKLCLQTHIVHCFKKNKKNTQEVVCWSMKPNENDMMKKSLVYQTKTN